MCGQMGHLTRMCKQQTAAPEAKDKLVKAYVPEANVILVKAITPEAKHKKGVKVECEVRHSQDHNEPEALQINLVKVECEAGSARDHNAPEAKVKVRGHETNDAGYTEIFLQDRYSDIVRVAPENTVVGKSSRVEKKAKFKPISERDYPIQCDHLSSEIDVKMEELACWLLPYCENRFNSLITIIEADLK
ncbi:hypothetical protein PRIPAC_89605 [Pristionchus pacificus]|uniref:Uncharacterized protein n=1 Tax=Pristionchus pacificus TaxID=54126 RepID=A0A2A6B7X4_PRIPA|nr:hypothetical protein PRIPAC_89605 [Pristionchus pacificus]|eukprot:PDM61976.1 hypothetical protein PRIPAC_51418 [Pristionchus pacificus]